MSNTTTNHDRLSHEECACTPAVATAVYCPYCGEEIAESEHEIDAELPEVFCPNGIMSTPRYCMGCAVPVAEYDWPASEPEDPYRYWSAGLMAAVRNDAHTVELVEFETGDAQVEIDGVAMFDGLAYPSEQFNIAAGDEYQQYLTADGRAKLREVSKDGDSE